jgi:hypothetical protein
VVVICIFLGFFSVTLVFSFVFPVVSRLIFSSCSVVCLEILKYQNSMVY